MKKIMDTHLIWISCIWGFIFTCIFLVWYFTHKARHKERMLMLEKGIEPGHLRKREFRFPFQKIGIILTGLAAGLLIIALLVGTDNMGSNNNALPFGILGACGGIAMMIASRIDKKNNSEGNG